MLKNKMKALLGRISSQPLINWIMLGFFVSYLLFFIYDQFLSRKGMSFYPYLPAKEEYGLDLRTTFYFLSRWYVDKQTPYAVGSIHAYPPLINVLLLPLFFLKFTTAFKILTLLSIASYLGIIYIFLAPEEKFFSPISILVIITGLISYGFQFQLERGQFDFLIIFICFLAVWLFHHKKNLRFFSYLLFAISVNTKLYPLIFILMFMDDLHDWKDNIKRMLIIGILNVAMLFVLGPKVFADFINAITRNAESKNSWIGNHSIVSFINYLFARLSSAFQWDGLIQYIGLASSLLMFITIGCIVLVWIKSYRQNVKGFNSVLFFACTIGVLTITPSSHDYTLPLLSLPAILMFMNEDFWAGFNKQGLQILSVFLLFAFSVAYSSTLFSYIKKPQSWDGILESNFIPLFGMLLIITLVLLLPRYKSINKDGL